MYSTMLFILLSLFSFLYIFSKWFNPKSGSSARLPPGPYPIPIIGSMFKLGNKPHHTLAALSETYGPLMSLKLGSITTIVVSSREIVQEVFSKHDMSFSSRTVPYSAYYGYTQNLKKNSVIWLPVGDKWRSIRKVLKEQLFSIRQLDASQNLRKKKVQELLNYVQDCSTNQKTVNINHTAAIATLNVLSNFIFSVDIAHYDSTSTEEKFRDIILGVVKYGGTSFLADFFPVFRHLDPNGSLKRSDPATRKLMAILEKHINDRMEERAKRSADAPSSTNDLTDLLLDNLQNEIPSISLDDMPVLLFVSIFFYTIIRQ
ncbi:cytochrome P450 [Artemisia annua]|uniref:Cytochrome P450 n=1 Tax=Artemisia annua TaxID=35608 RepID=A0A2U1KQC5_ARTAN|nr:cytochrome P450 [Artemisia annua]